MLRVRMNRILSELDVRYNDFDDTFVITIPEIDEVKCIINYNDFPFVQYNYDRCESFIEVKDCDDVDEKLAEIINFVDNEKEKIKKIAKELKKII